MMVGQGSPVCGGQHDHHAVSQERSRAEKQSRNSLCKGPEAGKQVASASRREGKGQKVRKGADYVGLLNHGKHFELTKRNWKPLKGFKQEKGVT